VFLVVLGVSLANATNYFFGCTMAPATPLVTVGGWGSVACMSGNIDAVSYLTCEFQWQNLTTNPTVCHFHVGNSTTNGPVVFTNDVSTGVAAGGTGYSKFVASNTVTWTQRNGVAFDAQIALCNAGDGCYFNLHTVNFPGGELRCQATALVTKFAFAAVPLVIAPGATGATGSTGAATVQIAEVLPSVTPKVFAVGYYASFVVQTNIVNAHIHQGTSMTDNSGPVKVQFDWGTPRTTGEFTGVALSGVTSGQQLSSNWGTYVVSDFDGAINNHFCYVNIHTTGNAGGEIRANIAPGSGSSASTVSVALMAVVFMIASALSL